MIPGSVLSIFLFIKQLSLQSCNAAPHSATEVGQSRTEEKLRPRHKTPEMPGGFPPLRETLSPSLRPSLEGLLTSWKVLLSSWLP